MISKRDSGIDVLGRVAWGTHFCAFYRTREDLADILVPYFEAGLKNNEFCMCIASEPFTAGEVKARMAEAITDFRKYARKGQIEIIPYDEWYLIDGVFDSRRVLDGWLDKLQKARARGFSGLRLSGNTFWLEKSGWKSFQDYEREINDTIINYSMIALCTYSLDLCSASDVLDVANTHQFVISKLDGRWNIIEGQEQKRARKALQESDVRFRSLIQNSSDIIRILDRDGLIIFDSSSSLKILGYRPEDTLGRSPLDFVHPDDREKVRKGLAEVYDNANPGTPTEFRIRMADGKYLDVESTGMNMFGVPGVDGIVINTRPITERKRMEEELRAAKEKAELYLDLMSHDISNINQVAMGYLELANDTLALSGEDKELIARPLEALKNSSALIDNVRKLQRVAEGRLKTDVIDLKALISKLLGDYRDAGGREVAIRLEANGDCHVRANGLVHDVFANLIGNAIKHSAPDRRLEINIKIGKASFNGKEYCRVAVEDSGPGIPDGIKDKLFNRFQRGDTMARGKGLGLYLVRSLVEGFHGRVWVEDRVSGDYTLGARFVVMLPSVEK